MSSVRVYLFDIDGTLVDSPKSVGRLAFEEALQSVAGLSQGLDGVTLHGNTDPGILADAWQAHFGRLPTEDEAGAVLAEYLRNLGRYARKPDAIRLLPAVSECLERLEQSGHVVGLATGNLEQGARIKLEAVGLWARFAFGGFGSDASDRTELVLAGLRKAELHAGRSFSPSDFWVVGDTPRDIMAAHRAGVRCIAVATGIHPEEELDAAGAEITIPTLAEFPE